MLFPLLLLVFIFLVLFLFLFFLLLGKNTWNPLLTYHVANGYPVVPPERLVVEPPTMHPQKRGQQRQ